MFKPALVTALKKYSGDQLRKDVIAGVIVGILALPLSIAFAIASGLSPYQGIITAILAGGIISLLGGSSVQIGGPTGAFVVIIYKIVAEQGVDALVVATVMAGVMLVILGLFRMGSIIKLIPYPLVVGITSGLAVAIFSSQVYDFLGLVQPLPVDFLLRWKLYLTSLATVNPWTILIGTLSIGILLLWRRVPSRIPGALVVLVVTTALVYYFRLPVATIGSKFGSIPASLPAPIFPVVSWARALELIPVAITIAFLGGMESLLSAVVADGMTGHRHNSNTELLAQGVANIVTPFFGGIPATGAIARTATNVHNGGRTPVAGIVHSLVLLLITIFLGNLVSMVPLACLAAILLTIAVRMADPRSFMVVMRSSFSDVVVLLASSLITVLLDITIAIEVGVALAILLFIWRMSLATQIRRSFGRVLSIAGVHKSKEKHLSKGEQTDGLGSQIEVYELHGTLFFGASYKFLQVLDMIGVRAKVIILRMRHVLDLDATGLHALREVHNTLSKQGIVMLLSEVRRQPLALLKRSGFIKELGRGHIYRNWENALKWANHRLAESETKE